MFILCYRNNHTIEKGYILACPTFFYLGRDLQSAEWNQTTNTISCYEYKYLNKVFPISLLFDFPNENDFFINFSSIPNRNIPPVLLNLS